MTYYSWCLLLVFHLLINLSLIDPCTRTGVWHSWTTLKFSNYEVWFEMIWNRLPCAPSIFQPHGVRDTRVFMCLTKTPVLESARVVDEQIQRFSFTDGGRNKPQNRLIEIGSIQAVLLFPVGGMSSRTKRWMAETIKLDPRSKRSPHVWIEFDTAIILDVEIKF
jgi:hypothetical protein